MNTLRSAWAKTRGFVGRHKIISVLIAVVVVGGGYFVHKHYSTTTTQTRYVLGTVERGTLTVSVSGSGQVSASDQVDIKPKVSGTVLSVNVTSGQTVKKGDVIATLDAGDATKALRDAQLNLESAQLSYEKTVKPADTITVSDAQNALDDANRSLSDSYQNTYATIADTFIHLPDIMKSLEDYLLHQTSQSYLYSENIRSSSGNTALDRYETVVSGFSDVNTEYQKVLSDYQSISRTSDEATLTSVLSETNDLTSKVLDLSKNLKSFVDYMETQQQKNSVYTTAINADQATLSGYISTLTNELSSLLSSKTTIANAKQSVLDKTQALADVNAGADDIDVESAQISLTQRQNALADAEEALGDYTVRAPIDGVIASVDAKVGDSGSSGTAVATVITKEQIAEISLNELDAAKIKVGDKATLTFDAIPDLTISGEVIEANLIGTVTQGVVSYSMKIGFDTQDDRVKPGMSMSAAIITDEKTDVLTVPNSAIKTATDGTASVQILPSAASSTGASAASGVTSETPPQSVEIETGLASDTSTEVVSGLTEGEQIVVRTITTSATTATTAGTGSLLGGGANRAGAGGAGAAAGRTFGR